MQFGEKTLKECSELKEIGIDISKHPLLTEDQLDEIELVRKEAWEKVPSKTKTHPLVHRHYRNAKNMY